MTMKLQQPVTALFIAVYVLLASQNLWTQGTPTPTLTVALEKDAITQHEPVIVDFSLKNPTSKEVDFELGYEHEKVKVEVIDPDGQVWPRPRPIPHEGIVFRQGVQAPAGTTRVSSVLLNNWFNFDKLGQYQINIAVPPSRNSLAGDIDLKGVSLFLAVLPRHEDSLKSACADLVIRVNSKSAADANVAADALSKINDPVAVPFLAKAMKRKWFTSMMIAALARLNTPDAINALISASRSGDPETSALAGAALVALEKAEPHH